MAFRKFKIKLDGKVYEVEVEEIIEMESPLRTEIKNEDVLPVITRQPQNKSRAPGSGKTIVAPMPGKIIAVKCSIGQEVKTGETLIILEAMKMEQEIKAKADGIISDIKIAAGDTVQKDDVLIIIN